MAFGSRRGLYTDDERPPVNARKVGLALLFGAMLCVAAAYGAILVTGVASTPVNWVIAVATPVAMVATMMLGAAREGRRAGGLGGLVLPLALVLVVLVAGFALALALPGGEEPLWLGLPRRAAILVYGVGIVPLLVLPLAYAATFDDLSLSEQDIAEIDKLRAGSAEESAP